MRLLLFGWFVVLVLLFVDKNRTEGIEGAWDETRVFFKIWRKFLVDKGECFVTNYVKSEVVFDFLDNGRNWKRLIKILAERRLLTAHWIKWSKKKNTNFVMWWYYRPISEGIIHKGDNKFKVLHEQKSKHKIIKQVNL